MTIDRQNVRRAQRLAKAGLGDVENLINDMAADYVRAQAYVSRETADAISSGKLGQLRYRQEREREARRILRRVDKTSVPKARRVVKESVRLGDRVAKTAGIASTPSTYSRVNQVAIEALVDNLSHRLGDATRTVGRRVEDLYRREGLRIAAMQLTKEKTEPDAMRLLKQRLRRQGVTSFTDRSGREWNLDTYARMVIKTVSSEAVFTGTQNRVLARGFDLVQVNSVQNPCPKCQQYDGNTYSLTGRTDRHPQLGIVFPIHPNCRHFISPAVDAAEERQEWRDAQEQEAQAA